MSLFTATAVAFTAAVIEGKSILDHANKRQSVIEGLPGTSDENIILPCIAYGALSLPLTIIGASPSLYLVSKVFHLNPNLINEDDNIEQIAKLETETTSTNDLEIAKPHRGMKLEADNNNSNSIENTQLETLHGDVSQRRRFNVKRVREENRQALSALRERREMDQIQHNRADFVAHTIVRDHHAAQSTRNIRQLSSYISTLDGRVLPTSLGESMRRVRILALSYGMISSIIAYQLHSLHGGKDVKHKKQHQDRVLFGNDPSAVQDFVSNFDEKTSYSMKGGIAMRLFHAYDDLEKYSKLRVNSSNVKSNHESSSDCCIIPIVSSRLDKNASNQNDMLYWSMGHTESDWKKLPIDTRWIFQHTDSLDGAESQPFILFESNLFPSLSESIEEASKRRGIYSRSHNSQKFRAQDSIVEAKKIKHIALSKLFPNAGHNYRLGMVNVFVGIGAGGENHMFGIHEDEKVYINGLDAIANCIVKEVDNIRTLKRDKNKREHPSNDYMSALFTETISKNEATEYSLPIHVVESLGRYIRQLSVRAGSKLAKLVPKFDRGLHKDRVIMHIFSDSPEMMKWVENILQNDCIHAKFYNVETKDINTEFQKESCENDIFLFLCSSDMTTINVASNVMQRNTEMKNSITILETSSCKDSLRVLTKSLLSNDENMHTTLCVDLIHDQLFDLARKLLREGNSASNVQKAIQQEYNRS